jgi:hypothetical protein
LPRIKSALARPSRPKIKSKSKVRSI